MSGDELVFWGYVAFAVAGISVAVVCAVRMTRAAAVEAEVDVEVTW